MRRSIALLIFVLLPLSAFAQTAYETSLQIDGHAASKSGATAQLDCPETLLLGQDLAFNGSFSNTGTIPIDGAFFRMTVNNRLSLTSGATTQGTWTGGGMLLQLNMGTLQPQQRVDFDLNIATAAPGTATIETVFGFSGGSNPPQSCEIEILEEADLFIEKIANPQGTVLVSDMLTYLLAIGNAGPHTATNVMIQDVLPPSVEVVNVEIDAGSTATGASCEVNDGTLLCLIEQLGMTTQEDDFVLIVVEVIATEAGTLENQASVTAATNDPNPQNNDSATIVTEVEERMPVLEIRKTASVGPDVTIGRAFSYLVTVTNSGNGTAPAVMMTDMLPTTVTVTAVTPSTGATCTQAGTTLNCDLGDIAPDQTVTVQIDVVAATVGNATNFANIDGGSANVELSIIEAPTSQISGQKFLDLDGDGVKDPGEPGMNGVTIELVDATGAVVGRQVTGSQDLNDDGMIAPETEQGLYTFENVPAGMYTLREVVPLFFLQTFPAAPGTHAVVVASGVSLNGFLFGNAPFGLGFDFGDLPDPRTDSHCPVLGGYSTRLASNGPFHFIDRDKAILGTRIDEEGNGQPDAAALGDDVNGPMASTDEDGLVSMSILADGTIRFEVVATVPPGEPAFLDVWVDLNDNCSFEQLAPPLSGGFDYVLVRRPMVNGINVLTTASGLADPDDVLGYTRLRISSTGTNFPTGSADDGEVEDYFIIGLDFGDAPSSIDPDFPNFPGGYPTTLAQDGARHIAVSNVRLGDLIDTEGLVDGRFDALEDDDNMPQDDEDGFEFLDGFNLLTEMLGDDEIEIVEVEQNADALLLPLPSTNGRLDAWIDFNRDGDWEDDGEQIFDNEDINPMMEKDDALTVKIPDDAELGFTYARFRFSRNGNLSFQGGAPNGEVEDYLLRIIEAPDTTPVEEYEDGQITFQLRGNAPNPFNPTTMLHFDLPETAEVHVAIFDLLGREVLTLAPHRIEAGLDRALRLDASSLPSGVYLYTLRVQSATRTHTATGRFVLMK